MATGATPSIVFIMGYFGSFISGNPFNTTCNVLSTPNYTGRPSLPLFMLAGRLSLRADFCELPLLSDLKEFNIIRHRSQVNKQMILSLLAEDKSKSQNYWIWIVS